MFKELEIREINAVLENNYIGQLGYIYLNRPYVIPISYYFDKESNAVICYSDEGHKMQAMRKNNVVSLQVSDVISVTEWKSVLVHGVFKQCFGSEAKAYLHKFSLGIKDIILKKEHQKPSFIKEFSSDIQENHIPQVFLIHIETITGKKRK